MKIYIPHSTSFDYKTELYAPVRSSAPNFRHEIVLPHEGAINPVDTREAIRGADLIIAEVSYPSTGMGIELGWADMMGKPVVAIYKTGCAPSAAVGIVTDAL